MKTANSLREKDGIEAEEEDNEPQEPDLVDIMYNTSGRRLRAEMRRTAMEEETCATV
jgi:hypothetical protein